MKKLNHRDTGKRQAWNAPSFPNQNYYEQQAERRS